MDAQDLLREQTVVPGNSTKDFEESEVFIDFIDDSNSTREEYITFGSTEPSNKEPFNEYENEKR